MAQVREVTVTIIATEHGGGVGAVTETLSAGCGCASGGLDDAEVRATGQ